VTCDTLFTAFRELATIRFTYFSVKTILQQILFRPKKYRFAVIFSSVTFRVGLSNSTWYTYGRRLTRRVSQPLDRVSAASGRQSITDNGPARPRDQQ